MRKPIVLDLDGVIADIASSIEEQYQNIDYSNWLLKDTNSKKALDLFSDKLFWKNIKPFSDSWHQVNYWFFNEVDVNIVTARRTVASVKSTVPWLESWRINTLIPYFVPLNGKIEIIKQIDPLFVVEDNPYEIKILEKAGFKCFLMKAWYNENYWNSMDSIDSLREIDLERM
jgi:hypothetical protein